MSNIENDKYLDTLIDYYEDEENWEKVDNDIIQALEEQYGL